MQKLYDEHKQLRALSARLRQLCNQPEPDNSEFTSLRLQLSRALIEHFQSEETLLNPALRNDPGLDREQLKAWDADLRNLREAYSEHVRKWPLNHILEDWQGYRCDVLERIDAAEIRMRMEEREIYPRVVKPARAGTGLASL